MLVTPVPNQGDILLGRDTQGRVLRVSAHPNLDRVVLSIWQGGDCLATIRFASGDVAQLQQVLAGLTGTPVAVDSWAHSA